MYSIMKNKQKEEIELPILKNKEKMDEMAEQNYAGMKQEETRQGLGIGFWKKSLAAIKDLFFGKKIIIHHAADSEMEKLTTKKEGIQYSFLEKVKMWFTPKKKREDQKFISEHEEDLKEIWGVENVKTMEVRKKEDVIERIKFSMLGTYEKEFKAAFKSRVLHKEENDEEVIKNVEKIEKGLEKIRAEQKKIKPLFSKIRKEMVGSVALTNQWKDEHFDMMNQWFFFIDESSMIMALLTPEAQEKTFKDVFDFANEFSDTVHCFFDRIQLTARRNIPNKTIDTKSSIRDLSNKIKEQIKRINEDIR